MIRSTLSILLAVLAIVHGQESFECGLYDQAKDLNFTDFNSLELDGNWRKKDEYLLPDALYWHVYALASGEEPRFSTYPDGLLEPKLSGSKVWFKGTNVVKDLGYKKKDRIDASVNLFIPIDKLSYLKAEGVDHGYQLIADDASIFQDMDNSIINIHDSGVDNKWHVHAPYTKIHYKGSGVDNKAYIESGEGSSIELSGVDQTAEIKSDFLTKVRISGVDQKVYIEGDYEKISMSGVDSRAYVNGESGCDHVDKDGVDNKCQTWEGNVTVPELNCVVSAKVVEGCNDCWNLSTGATVGVAVGGLAILVACCAGCFLCFKACCCGAKEKFMYDANNDMYMPNKTQGFQEQHVPPQSSGVVQAEVIEVQPTAHAASTFSQDVEAGQNKEHVQAKVF